jgi:hypothetical protein
MVFITILAIPMSRYTAWIMDGRYNPPAFLRWFEKRLDSGGQNWKQYAAALLIFNTAMFIYGYKRDQAQIRGEIEQILQADVSAPFNGLVGRKW